MKVFQRAQHSLFGEILDWMLTPLLLLIPVSLGVTWLVAQGIANAAFDRTLEYNVRTLAQLVQEQREPFDLPLPARMILRGDKTDRVYFQVLSARGEALGGEADLPPPPVQEAQRIGVVELRDDTIRDSDLRIGAVQLRDDKMRGSDVRIAHTWIQPALAGAQPLLVQVAETRNKQHVLATEIIKGVLLPQLAILPLAIMLLWLALARGIRPLSDLEQRIRARRSDDLSPLADYDVPYEVAPLVDSVNGLLTKLKESIATQRRFLADAAHQLKTPLAGLRMQADLAQRDGADAGELKRSLQQIGRASVSATHTVNQLLALARAEGGAGALGWQPCDLAQLAIEVVREAVPRAIDKRIDLGYEGLPPDAPGVQVEGNPTLLKELVRNLVDNAVAYTPSSTDQPGVITARVLADPFGHVLVLQVENSGPGIPEAVRDRVFEPFFRVLGNEADGSGLGLPIVREIARQHHATVSLEDAHPAMRPPGTRFSVRFDTAKR